MKKVTKGWVICNSTTGLICNKYFRPHEKECIEALEKATVYDWETWKSKWNLDCVKATQTIEIE